MTKNFTLAENITTENNQNFIVNREVPAYKITFRTASSNEVKKLLRNYVRVNIGEHYNTISSRFEVPVAGTYVYTFQGSFGPGVAQIELRINDEIRAINYKNTLEEFSSVSLYTIEMCEQGDFVEYFYRGDPKENDTQDGFFGTGFLLG